MFRLTRKGLWAHKLRFALTGLAVVLGVAFMSGTQILTDTMGKTFDGIFEDANEGVDVVVRRAAAVESAFDVDVRERVDTATLNRIRAIAGVSVAAGSIEGQAVLVGPDGKAQAGTAFGGAMGANWVDDQRLNPFTISSQPGAASGTLFRHCVRKSSSSISVRAVPTRAKAPTSARPARPSPSPSASRRP